MCLQTATPIGNTGLLHGVDHWSVSSGTGRFTGVIGAGTGNTYVYNLSTFVKTATGTITE